jgi:glutamate-1-semialdehyde 2,1-aminomutase
LAELEKKYMLEKSSYLFEQSKQSIPGGVNSPARAFKSVGGPPVFIEKAKGSVLTDADGNEYIDFVSSWGPMILGHAYEPVIQAVQEAAEKSTSFGAPTEVELKMAELVKKLVPGVDKIRMVNSGTEACMSAIRTARGYTGNDKIIKFGGNYHGHADSFLIDAGSGALTLGTPSSPGVTKGTAKDTLTANFNDLQSVEQLIDKHRGEIAGIIMEPVAGNMGCIPPEDGFLEDLRELCTDENIILIFDEVMTGFRLGKGGAQELYGITPDLSTFGKIIGGGLPVGAFGGKQEIMDAVAPAGPVYQAGTLSGNPLAMAAGYALLSELNENPRLYKELEQKGVQLEQGLKDAFIEKDISVVINRVGSMLSIYFTNEEKVTNFAEANTTDREKFKSFFHQMLERGIYLPPSPFESWFLADSMNDSMINQTIEAAGKSLKMME